MAAKLKVFSWSDGLHVWSVATTSRPKALEAWGATQDLFKTGMAAELEGGEDYDAALKAPGKVLERTLDVSVEDGPKPKTAAAKMGVKPKLTVVRDKPKGPPKGAVKAAAKAEAALAALDEKQGKAMRAAVKAAARAEAALDAARDTERKLASKHRKARDKAVLAVKDAKSRLA